MIELNKRQKAILSKLIDKYEDSRTYRNKNQIKQSFRVMPSDFYRDYDSDYADLDEQGDFERELKILENTGFVRCVRKNGIIKSIILEDDSVQACYALLGRTELADIERKQIQMFESALTESMKNKVLLSFCSEQIERIKNGKKPEYNTEVSESIIKILTYISDITEEILERELSIELFGNTKIFEKEYRNKVISILKKHGDFDEIIEEYPGDKEAGHAVLAEYNVVANPTYIFLKGDGRIVFGDNRIMELGTVTPMAIVSGALGCISKFEIAADRIVTVENLTSFNRVNDRSTFFVYLAGYHNSAKQKLIKMIEAHNPRKKWLHFGDIDPDGFYILEKLKEKTGIDFQPFGMSVDELLRFEKYCKPLEKNDIVKAKSLFEKGLYTDEMQYMLEHNVKLEQEVISWKMQANEGVHG